VDIEEHVFVSCLCSTVCSWEVLIHMDQGGAYSLGQKLLAKLTLSFSGAIDLNINLQHVHFTFDARLSKLHKLPIILPWRTETLLQKLFLLQLRRARIGSKI
jgi:hypothetical protein